MNPHRRTGRLNYSIALPPCDTRPVFAGCMALVCDACGHQTSYNADVIDLGDGTPIQADCECGARRWLFPCEIGKCSDKAEYDQRMYG